MEIEAITRGIGLFTAAITAIKQAKDLLPNSPNKEEVEKAIIHAERELKIAEAGIASELGFQLCKHHFPPVIMLEEEDQRWICPECGNKKSTRLAVALL